MNNIIKKNCKCFTYRYKMFSTFSNIVENFLGFQFCLSVCLSLTCVNISKVPCYRCTLYMEISVASVACSILNEMCSTYSSVAGHSKKFCYMVYGWGYLFNVFFKKVTLFKDIETNIHH